MSTEECDSSWIGGVRAPEPKAKRCVVVCHSVHSPHPVITFHN